jgi:long-chain acyl-CoA synthetase
MNFGTELLKEALAGTPDAMALVCGDQRWTFAELDHQAGRIAAALAGCGVRRGDRVAIVMDSRPEYVATLLGCARIGAILTTVHLEFRTAEMRYILESSEPRCLVVDDTGAAALEAAGVDVSATAAVLSLGGSLDAAMASAPDASVEEMAPEDAVLILYTSGTVAKPKAVLGSHGAELWSAEAHQRVWGFEPGDCVLVPLTLAWAYGLMSVTASALSGGAKVVLLPHFHPRAMGQTIEAEQVSSIFGVTTMFVMLSNYWRERDDVPDMSSVRFVLSSGERRDERAFAWLTERCAATGVYDAYAMSEVRPVTTYDPRVEAGPVGTSVGRLVAGVELRLVGEDGEDAAPGEPGEAWLRSPGMLSGYFRQPEITASRLTPDGWFKTGDFLSMNPDGYCWFVSRSTDLIRRAGSNVSPLEVQNALAEHPLVEDVAAAAVPDDTYGEAVGAVVVLRGPAAEGEDVCELLRRHTAGLLAEYKVPSVVLVVSEIPRRANGKFDRKRISTLLATAREERA